MEMQDSAHKGKGKALDDDNNHLLINQRLGADRRESVKQKENDVLIYEKYVKIAFQDQIEIYALFNKIVHDFIGDGISGEDTMGMMNRLLEGHEKLRVGFKRFLSLKYELVTGEKRTDPFNIIDSLNFVRKVQRSFWDQPGKHDTFHDILKSYRNNEVNIAEVCSALECLFQDRLDLLRDCRKFFPREWTTRSEYIHTCHRCMICLRCHRCCRMSL